MKPNQYLEEYSTLELTPDVTLSDDGLSQNLLGSDYNANADSHVLVSIEQSGRSLLIDADLPLITHETNYSIVLSKNVNTNNLASVLFQELTADGLVSDYNQANQEYIVHDSTGNVIAYLSSLNNILTYEDLKRTLNGEYINSSSIYRYSGFTNEVPGDIKIDSNEAINSVANYFESISAFSYTPYKVLAATDQSVGYYTIYLQASYKDIPICTRSTDGRTFGVHASLSNDGLFYFQGLFAFEPQSTKHFETGVSFDYIFREFTDSYFKFALADNMTIYRIVCEFIPCKTNDGTYELRPGWSFYGKSNEGNGVYIDWVYSYSLEDGVLCLSDPLI